MFMRVPCIFILFLLQATNDTYIYQNIFSLYLCIFTVRFTYSYCSTTLNEVFLCFFLSCKANAKVKLAKSGHGPHSSKLFVLFSNFVLCSNFVLFYVLFVLCRSVYCLCVDLYCTTATGWQPNCS
jgi:hypothetical protein